MDRIAHHGPTRIEAEIPTDLLAGLLMQRGSEALQAIREPNRLTARIYAVMALTSLLTFGTLVMGYQLLFSHQLFA